MSYESRRPIRKIIRLVIILVMLGIIVYLYFITQ